MKRRKPPEQQETPATHDGRETTEPFAASHLELDALRAMLGLPNKPTSVDRGPDETGVPND